ncbi:type II toxin-antitoxin system PemK/MazF family toxin [Tychonema sp. LEGE 07199]|uniref:type II toxin-antitoxin system PemK/MazF family toxin n=1 Tax=Microcoleaceae TaxID=1892252 RepID=UPI001880F75E|nr:MULTISPECIES: type II toxin-antitoxin system PemK/MazF family toxin [unclassified Tychonema]MBE9124571.1 type II toxin-antitoxin system PemK/MazF family toxin [Tychonema sp. LEGE 07199]MBE9135218.1 type II toxin-antitoxin system PemK/MazF family toxin [Tychonema sp. LEGE 07196]
MRKGEIWLVALDPTVGAEIGKTRPAVIVSDETVGILLLEVIVPITDWKERYAQRNWMVRLEPSSENGLIKVSAADCYQVRSVSQQRFVRQLGTVSETIIEEVAEALTIVLDLD